jgi:hypothetical protein
VPSPRVETSRTPLASSRRTPLWLAGVLAAAVVAPGCGDPTVTVTMTAAELQREISARLPRTRAGRLVSATVQSAEVVLTDGSDRVGVRAATTLQLPGGHSLAGAVQLDGKLRYVAGAGEFWLDEVRVVDLGIAAIPTALRPVAEELVGSIARNYLARTPVYRLKQESFKQSLAKLVLRQVVVRDGTLAVTLALPRAGR